MFDAEDGPMPSDFEESARDWRRGSCSATWTATFRFSRVAKDMWGAGDDC